MPFLFNIPFFLNSPVFCLFNLEFTKSKILTIIVPSNQFLRIGVTQLISPAWLHIVTICNLLGSLLFPYFLLKKKKKNPNFKVSFNIFDLQIVCNQNPLLLSFDHSLLLTINFHRTKIFLWHHLFPLSSFKSIHFLCIPLSA